MTPRPQRGVSTLVWTLLTAVAVLWPARTIGPLDGVPLDHALEAILIGIGLPLVWALHRPFVATRVARIMVVALVLWKATLSLAVTQQGLCAHTSVRQPLDAIFLQMPIREPSGVLRSWDVRADWNASSPTCTAILTRHLPDEPSFPAWFVNITDQLIGRREIDMAVRGFVTMREPASFSIGVDRGVQIDGQIDGQHYAGVPLALAAGTHRIDLALVLTGDQWRFEPRLDEAPLWSRSLVTIAEPTWFDRAVAPWAWLVTAALVLALMSTWVASAFADLRPGIPAMVASGAMVAVAVVLALQPSLMLRRGIGLLAFASLLVPVSRHARNVKGLLLLIAVPWVAFFVARCFADIGRFTAFSPDDWLAYQLAGYRIFMHGFYLEGGTPSFDYQPLYRWINGALHLTFGDSSVGEHYWDAACLALGASLSYHLVRPRAGFRWGMFAAAATLATFSLGTPWYFIGRSLSEVSAAGWSFLAMLLLLRARHGRVTWSVSAGIAAVLMLYTRLNHLLFAAFLPALLIPTRVPTVGSQLMRSFGRLRPIKIAMYALVFAGGVAALMARTWLYTGELSLFYGTSLNSNDTGLRSFDVLNSVMWGNVGHSLASFVFMNEPAIPGIRALFVIAGAAVALAALCQVPKLRQVPAAVVIVAFGASAGSFFAHGHPYQGRFSIHFVPLAVALSTIALAMAVRARTVESRSVPTRRTVEV